MYDLHCHILPGVDDGAKTPKDTMQMVRVAAAQGTKVIVASPHRKDVTENWSVDHVRNLLDEANRRSQNEGIDLALMPGMENHLDLELPEDASSGVALTLNGSRYILVEMPFFGRPNYVEDVLFRLQLQGLTPVLAHPERIEAFQNDLGLLSIFVERGMLCQVTAGSIVGYFGGQVQRFTRTLLRRGLVHIIASDAHFPDGRRSPALQPGVDAAAHLVGPERARAMVEDTPRAIVENLPVKAEPPGQVVQPRRWWRFWGAG